MTAVVPVFHPRAEPRRAVKRSYPRAAGSVRLCRTLAAVERLLNQRLVDAVVLDVKAAPAAALRLPARFPRIPMFVLSALRPDDGPLLAACHASGFAGLLVEGVDNAVAGEWVAARTAQVARREALADAPRLLRLTDRLQLAAWEEVLRRVRRRPAREPGLLGARGREDPGLCLAQPPGGCRPTGRRGDCAGTARRGAARRVGAIPKRKDTIARVASGCGEYHM